MTDFTSIDARLTAVELLRGRRLVLRDTIESGRMPSGLPLERDAAELHERAADHLQILVDRLPAKR